MKKKKSVKAQEIHRAAVIMTKLGFVIHGALEKPLFPTHTHGLTEMEMPEFIFDPLAFGAQGNANRIMAAYTYLSQARNADQLQDIWDGLTVRLTDYDLVPEYTGDHYHTYFLRKVSPDFEGVRLAYYATEIVPEMWFIQMYVEGDDYVLTDEYYRGGVTW